MEDAPIVSDDRQEAARLNALRGLDILDGATNQPPFLRFARLAARLFDAPKAALVLVDADRIWRKAYLGYSGPEGPRDGDLAARVVAANAPVGLAVPIRDAQGHALGALVVEGPGLSGPASDEDLQALEDLADLAAISLAAKPCTARNLESERLDLAISAASLGEFEWDIKRDVFKISPRLAKISDIPPGEIPGEDGQALYQYLHPDDRAWLKESIDQQLAETDRYEAEYRRPNGPDGREIWNHGSGVILRDADGEPAYLIGVVQDITARKAEEEQRENLVVELDHRIKNLLAVVQSVAAQSARKSASLDVFLKTFAGRLKSMSLGPRPPDRRRWRGATLARIAAAELGGLAPTQTRWDGPELFLTRAPRRPCRWPCTNWPSTPCATARCPARTARSKWSGGARRGRLRTGVVGDRRPAGDPAQDQGLRRHPDRGRRRPRAGRLGQDQLPPQRRHRHDPGRGRSPGRRPADRGRPRPPPSASSRPSSPPTRTFAPARSPD
ncbi:HWE histidine kinase domain-containing protein [Caulobacter segnis]